MQVYMELSSGVTFRLSSKINSIHLEIQVFNFQNFSSFSCFWSFTDQCLTATMAQAMIQGMVKVLGNPSTWIHPLPDNHGK